MLKISSYLYPNRIELLADVAGFTTEYTNVYQKTVKIYNGIDNTIQFDIKNADQKRIDLATLSNIELNVMDAQGAGLPNSPYTVTPLNQATLKGIATVTIPQEDLVDLADQYLTFSVTATKDGNDVILYGDSRFGATGTIQLIGNAMPTFRNDRVYKDFTADIDLAGHPTYRSSSIPATFYEAVKTETMSFSIDIRGFTGSVWLEATEQSTINAEAWKDSTIIDSQTFTDFTGTWTPDSNSNTDIAIGDFKYFRIRWTTPRANGAGAQFTVTNTDGTIDVKVRTGGTGYAVGSQIKVFGSEIGGTNVSNDLTITVLGVDGNSTGYASSYSVSSIKEISWSMPDVISGSGTYIVSGKNITGTVDKITVS
jgi:hypothetical protein